MITGMASDNSAKRKSGDEKCIIESEPEFSEFIEFFEFLKSIIKVQTNKR